MFANSSRLCGALLIALLMTGCATSAYQPLTPEAKQQIRSTDTVIGVAQQEITAQINQSNVAAATGGGLLFALIDAGINSSRSSTAEDTVRPLRDALVTYNFDNNLRSRMDDHLGTISGMGVGNVKLTKEVTDNNYNALYQASNKDAVLFTSVNYSMTVDFSTLAINANALLFPKSAGLKALANLSDADLHNLPVKNSIYRNTINFTCKLPSPSKDLETNRNMWVANNAGLLVGALNLGTDEIANAISLDIPQAAAQSDGALQASGPGDVQRLRQKAGTILITSRGTPETFAARPVPVRSPVISSVPAPTAPTVQPVAVAVASQQAASTMSLAAASPTSNLQRLQAATILRDQPKSVAQAIATLDAGSPIQTISSMRNAEGEWAFVNASGKRGWINMPSGMTGSP